MSLEERVVNLEEFAADVRKFTQILTDMILRHDERLDEHAEMFEEANRSIAALADAQIHTEEAQARTDQRVEEYAADVRKYTQILTNIILRHDERLDEHAEAQARTEHSVNELIDILREDRNGNKSEK